jgi:site-specific recombinase XerD
MSRHSDENPAAIYRDSLSRGSYWAVHHSLETIVRLLGGADPWSYPWHRLRYCDTARVRAQLVERYAPATVNKILSALRGVLKTCWRLGLIDAETYARAADVANVRAKTLPSGRAVERDEVRALFTVCAEDSSPAGRRDAAMLAILYGAGLRRAELCGLDLNDFDSDGCVLKVRAGKGRRDRRVFLAKSVCEMVREWVTLRGGGDSPLFCPIGAAGAVRFTRLRGEAVRYILQKRQRQAGLEGITPHAVRHHYITSLLEAGIDVFTVQHLAGHADAVTTARYDRRGEAEKRRAASCLPIP